MTEVLSRNNLPPPAPLPLTTGDSGDTRTRIQKTDSRLTQQRCGTLRRLLLVTLIGGDLDDSLRHRVDGKLSKY